MKILRALWDAVILLLTCLVAGTVLTLSCFAGRQKPKPSRSQKEWQKYINDCHERDYGYRLTDE